MKSLRHLSDKYTKNFIKYTLIGILFMLSNVFFMWLFIDALNIPTIFGASVVVGGLFIAKFYTYIIINLIHKQFLKYLSAFAAFGIANILFMWLFVDILNIPTLISSTTIVFGLFILRFFAFDKIGLMKNDK